MKTFLTAFAALLAMSLPALASGDADAGEEIFKKCKSCHMVKSEDETIVKGGKTGPNLYGVIGRTAGSVEGFKYSKSMISAGEAGLEWDEEKLAEYVQDPSAYLKKVLDDPKARAKMSFKLKKGGENVAAYLATFSAAD